MSEINDVYIEFFGDPSDDKECYKRYSSTEPFNPVGNDAEVIHFVNAKIVERLKTALDNDARIYEERIEKLKEENKILWTKISELSRESV